MSGATRGRALRALAGALWFELWFFVAFPAGILWAAGVDPRPGPGWHVAPATVLLLGAHALMIATIASLMRGGGTHLPFDPPLELADGGLYARVRNPMYAAYVAIAFGEALLYRSLALAAYATGFWALVHVYLTRVEEPGLRARFGERYERYCAATGRWWPR